MDNATVFWSIIFPTAILPLILILAFFLLWRIIKWLGTAKVEANKPPVFSVLRQSTRRTVTVY